MFYRTAGRPFIRPLSTQEKGKI